MENIDVHEIAPAVDLIAAAVSEALDRRQITVGRAPSAADEQRDRAGRNADDLRRRIHHEADEDRPRQGNQHEVANRGRKGAAGAARAHAGMRRKGRCPSIGPVLDGNLWLRLAKHLNVLEARKHGATSTCESLRSGFPGARDLAKGFEEIVVVR
jgi:hypothetical protein